MDQKRIIVFDTVWLNIIMDLKLLLRNPWQLAKGPQQKDRSKKIFFFPHQLSSHSSSIRVHHTRSVGSTCCYHPRLTQKEGPVLFSWLDTREVLAYKLVPSASKLTNSSNPTYDLGSLWKLNLFVCRSPVRNVCQ